MSLARGSPGAAHMKTAPIGFSEQPEAVAHIGRRMYNGPVPDDERATITPSTLGIIFGAVLVILAIGGALAMPRPPLLPTAPTPMLTAAPPTATASGPAAIVPTASPVVTATATTVATSTPLGAASATPSSTPTTAPPTATRSPTPSGPAVYIVKAGDTLLEIAERFGVTTEAILQINDLVDPDNLTEGQALTIPPTPTAEPAGTPTATPTPRPITKYLVQPGDTLHAGVPVIGTASVH